MRNFDYFIEEGDVKLSSIDKELAKSLKIRALEREDFILSLNITDKGAVIIFEGIYDILIELCDAIVTLNGYKSYSHQASFALLKKFKEISEGDIEKLDIYRRKRHGSKYYAKKIFVYEAEDIINFYKNIKDKLINIIDRLVDVK